MPNSKPQMATKEQISIIKDLGMKATHDALNAMKTTTELAMEQAGSAGLTYIVMEVAHTMITASVMAMRTDFQDKKVPKEASEDDLLFVALAILATHGRGRGGFKGLDAARAQFKQLTGRNHDSPDWWKKPEEV